MNFIKNLLEKHRTLVRYIIVGGTMTLFEIFLVRALFKLGLQLVVANTLGIIIGNFIQFFLNMKFVFLRPANIKNLKIYIGTLLVSMTIANLVIHYSYIILKGLVSIDLAYYVAKVLSATSSFISNFIMQKTIYSRV